MLFGELQPALHQLGLGFRCREKFDSDPNLVASDFASGVLDAVGKIWNLPNTIIGLSYGAVGYGVGWVSYAVGWQTLPPDIIIGNNAIQFTNNPLAKIGAITIGNAITYGPRLPPDAPSLETPLHTVAQHELQHTFQSQQLGPFYLPTAVMSLGAGMLFNGYSHGPASFMERGPQMDPPRPW